MGNVGTLELAMGVSLGAFQAAMNTIKKTSEETGRLAERVTSIRPDTKGITEATSKLKEMQEQLKVTKSKQQAALIDGLDAEAKEARDQARKLRSQITDLQGDIQVAQAQKNAKTDRVVGISASVQAPLAAVVGAGIYEASQMADKAEKLMNLNKATGLTTNTLQELDFVAKQSGLDFEPLMKSVEKLQKNLGNENIQKQLQGMGIAVKDSNGKFRDMNAIFQDTIGALGRMPEGIERNNIATQLFGKSSAEMAPIIAMGAQGFGDLADQAHKTGAVMSGETLTAAAAMDEKFDAMNARLSGVKMMFGELALSIADAVMPALNVLIDVAKPVVGVFASIPKPISAGILAFVGVIAVSGPIIKAVQGMVAAYRAYKAAVMAGAVAQAALNPAMLAAIGVAAAVGIGVAAAAAVEEKKADEQIAKAKKAKGGQAALDKATKRAEEMASADGKSYTDALPSYTMPDTSKLSTAAAAIAAAPQSAAGLQSSGSLPGNTELVAHIRDIKEAVLRIMRVVEGSRLPVVTA